MIFIRDKVILRKVLYLPPKSWKYMKIQSANILWWRNVYEGY